MTLSLNPVPAPRSARSEGSSFPYSSPRVVSPAATWSGAQRRELSRSACGVRTLSHSDRTPRRSRGVGGDAHGDQNASVSRLAWDACGRSNGRSVDAALKAHEGPWRSVLKQALVSTCVGVLVAGGFHAAMSAQDVQLPQTPPNLITHTASVQ